MSMDKKKAVALRYNELEESAPRVIASGQGHIAAKIIEIAEESGVYIKEDSDLVDLLSQIDLGKEIPTELFQTVADILAFVYKLNNEYNK